MRTLVIVTFVLSMLSIANAFSLLREFDDESLLVPNMHRVRRAALSDESSESIKASGQESLGGRVARDVELKEASGESPEIDKADKEKVRHRRDDTIVSSGQEEGSGEEVKKPSARRRRSAEADEHVESSGQDVEGLGQA